MDTPISQAKTRRFPHSFIARLSENPVVLKELRSRMRGGRAFILITIYLTLLSGLVATIYLGFTATNNAPTITMDMSQSLGKTIFWVVVGLEAGMICFIAPAITAGSISGERERQTYDLLRTTLLSERALILGKLSSSLIFLVLLLTVAFPLQALAFYFGGITLEELLISFAMLLVTALAFCSMGIFISSLSHRMVGSTVISYITSSLFVFGIPFFVYMLIFFIENTLIPSNNISTAQKETLEIANLIIGWIFVVLNPIGTTVVTELILMEGQSFISYTYSLSNGTNMFILSPWIGYLVFYCLLSLILLWWSTRLVRRRDR